MSKGERSRNDQRSDVKNPNNPEYKADQDNRSNQMNLNNPTYPRDRPDLRDPNIMDDDDDDDD